MLNSYSLSALPALLSRKIDLQPRILAITGASGSGKTRFTRLLSERLEPETTTVGLCEDYYYRDQSHMEMAERLRTNYDHPSSLEHKLLKRHLDRLRQGEPINAPTYDYHQHNRKKETQLIEPATLILVEGTLLLSQKELRDQFDLTVFLDMPLELCLQRRIDRDRVERGRSEESVVTQFEKSVVPMYSRFAEPARELADIVIDESMDDQQAISRVVDELKSRQLLAD